MALIGLLATLSVVQAAVPALYAANTNIGDAQQADISFDAFGNSYYLSYDSQDDVNVLVAVHPDGSKFTGCQSGNALASTLNTHLAGSKIAGFTVVADRAFPAAPSAASWLFATICAGTRCDLIRVPVANAATANGANCPVNWAGSIVNVGQISGTWTSGANNVVINCAKYASNLVSMTHNPVNGALYIGCTSSYTNPFSGGTAISSFVVQTQAMTVSANVLQGGFAAFAAANNVAYRISAASSIIGSMTVDNYGSLWVLDVARSMVFALKPFTTALDYPSTISSNVGLQAVWSKPTGTYKFLGVASDRSGNVYFSASDVSGSGWAGYVVTFPGLALITPPATLTVPRNWAYFNTGSFFESSTDLAAGLLTYDPYRGRLIVNGRMGWFNLPLFTVQFDFTNQPTTLFDANGAVCGSESATCVRVPVMVSNQPTSFTLRIAAPTWPATVTSLPFASNFLVSGASVAATSPFPTSITSGVFTNSPTNAAASYAAIGTTGSNLFTWTTPVTISNANGFAGVLTLSPAYTGASNDVAFLFTSLPSTSIVVQGSITATAISSTTFPLSSATLLAGVPTRYSLALSPAPSGTCTAASVTFGNSASHSYNIPPAAAPAAGNSLIVTFSGSTATVGYTTQLVSSYVWTGTFTGTGAGCTQNYGIAKVPFYTLAVTTQARPSIIVTPINQLISANPAVAATFTVQMIPGPSATVSPDIPVVFKSGASANPASVGTTAAPCTGDFTPTNSVFSNGCTSAAPCVISSLSFTPSSANCPLAGSASAAVVAEVTIPANFQASGGAGNYWFWNAATQAPAQSTSAASTLSVYTITSPLSLRMKWSATVPANQIVAPGAAVGPYVIDYTGSAVPVTFSTPFGGSFIALPAGSNAASFPLGANTASAAWTTGAVTVAPGTLVFFRAPSPATAAMLGQALGFDISMSTPTGVTYDAAGTPVAIQIRYVSSLSSPSNPRAATSVTGNTANINLWAGTSDRTRNTVTLSWGSGLLNAGNSITVYGNTQGANNLLGFFATGTTNPAISATALTAGIGASNAAGVTTCTTPGNNCASITFANVAVNTSSVTFLVAGGLPGAALGFYITVTGPDSTYFGFPAVPTARLFGQVLVTSLPTSISVNVPTFFGVAIDPPAPAAAAMVVSDAANSNFGTFLFCTDSSCGVNSPGTVGATVSFDLTTFSGPLSAAGTVLQYVPPTPPPPATCTGGLANQYPCQLGTNPTFGIDLDPSYAFDWSANVNNQVGGNWNTNTNKFKLTISNMPALQGSIAISFMNYEAANDATNAPIGAAATFTYPLSQTAAQTSLPVPMNSGANPKPTLNFLAGVRYVIGVTMYPPPAATASPQITVSYNENNVVIPISQNFTYNRADAAAPAPINGAPALNNSVNIFAAASTDFTGNRVDAALNGLGTPITALASMCAGGAVDANGRCFVGFFYWTVPSIVSGPPANNPRLTFTVTGAGVANYPTQNQTVKISGWCGPSPNLRDPLAPTVYAVPTTINAQCTPALTAVTGANFLNVFQSYVDSTPASVWSQPIFFAAANPFAPGATWTATTGAPHNAGGFAPAATAGSWVQVFRVAGDSGAVMTGAPASLIYTVTSLSNPTDRGASFASAVFSNYIPIRIFTPITGTYTVRVANADITGSCAVPAVNYLSDVTRLPSVSSTSSSFGQVCFYPYRVGNGPAGAPAFTVTVADGLGVNTNNFVATHLVQGAARAAFAAGVIGPATALVSAAGTTGGLTLGMAPDAGVIAYEGFNFQWSLTNAATNIADFRICSGLAAGAYTAGNLGTSCATNAFPSFPFGTTAGGLLSYRQIATSASSLAVTYGSNRVPISVTMKFAAKGFASDFLPNAVSSPAITFIVGETYAIELRTAATLSSPAVAGLTVTLNDLCGVLTYPGGGVAPTPAGSPAAVPARGQWSNTTLFYSPGETTKTVFYTPREICAPVGANNWGTILTANVITDATSPDGAATRFVSPISVYVYTYGAIRVDNVPAYLPAGVATPAPITVSLNPPILAAGQVAGAIAALSIPDIQVVVSDRAPATTVVAGGDALGGSFISAQNLGASATFNFATAGNRQSASATYVAPPSNFFLDGTAITNPGVSRGISFVVSGTGAQYYRIVGAASSVYNGLATIATTAAAPAPGSNDWWAQPTINPLAATFNLRVVPDYTSNPALSPANTGTASIEGVFFNVVGGAALAQSTAQSLATVSDNISQFVGNANVQPGQSNNAINFNLPFVSGVPFGYFAAVPFNMSAVVVNVATTANTVFVNNNGWPNRGSAGGSVGGYVLPNALSGYVSPVFFLTPGLNTFLVAAPTAALGDNFAFGALAGSGTLNDGANGDGIVYRFTIARDTITSFGLFVSANGHAGLPWNTQLPRLQPQFVAGTSTSLLAVGPGSGSAHTTFSVSVENAVASVGILAQFYGALKARVTSNVNEFGQILVTIPNNRLVDFPLVTPTNLPGVSAATTSITLLGGGLGPITINVNRQGKGFNFGAQYFASGSAVASNIVDGPNGPCITRGASTFGLAAYPSSRPGQAGLVIRGTYQIGAAAPVQITQTITPTSGWDVAAVANYVPLATLTTAGIPTTSLPIILNIAGVYTGNVPSEFTALNNYALNFCPA